MALKEKRTASSPVCVKCLLSFAVVHVYVCNPWLPGVLVSCWFSLTSLHGGKMVAWLCLQVVGDWATCLVQGRVPFASPCHWLWSECTAFVWEVHVILDWSRGFPSVSWLVTVCFLFTLCVIYTGLLNLTYRQFRFGARSHGSCHPWSRIDSSFSCGHEWI